MSGSASPEDFAAFLDEDAKLWARLVKESGAKADVDSGAPAEDRVHVAARSSCRWRRAPRRTSGSSGAAGRRAASAAVGGVEDVAHQLLAAVGLRHVVDARHDGVGLRALDLLARERVRDHRHVGGDAAFHRAFGARRRVRGARQGSRSQERCNYRFQVDLSKKEAPGFPGAAVVVQLLRFAGAAARAGWSPCRSRARSRGRFARSRAAAGLAAGRRRRAVPDGSARRAAARAAPDV